MGHVHETVERINRCTHDQSISVISDGVERVVCEQCGIVTVRYESMISGDVSRSQFARKADALHAERELMARAEAGARYVEEIA